VTARLTVTELAADHRRYILDCEHATTTVDYLIAPVGGATEDEILALLRFRHRQSCRCGWKRPQLDEVSRRYLASVGDIDS
jgi:hypothetical protein